MEGDSAADWISMFHVLLVKSFCTQIQFVLVSIYKFHDFQARLPQESHNTPARLPQGSHNTPARLPQESHNTPARLPQELP